MGPNVRAVGVGPGVVAIGVAVGLGVASSSPPPQATTIEPAVTRQISDMAMRGMMFVNMRRAEFPLYATIVLTCGLALNVSGFFHVCYVS